jgi:septum formation protein
MKLILASGSPQRKKLLEQIGIKFVAVTGKIDETIPDNSMIPEEIVKDIALRKARWVAEHTELMFDVVLGADTVVVYQDRILGKPENITQAREMLQLLNGTLHRVITGIAVITHNKTILDAVSTQVKMKTLTDDEIEDYLKTGEPIGKAGAVCIQGIGAKFIEYINGCFYNVVGLPIMRVVEILNQVGMKC